jgi:predicted DNA-binding protein
VSDKKRKTSTTVYVEVDQLERLKALSDKTKVPMAEYWRQAIELVLAKNGA